MIPVRDEGVIYVPHRLGDTVSVINRNTKEKNDIHIGMGPIAGAYDRYRHLIYIANMGSLGDCCPVSGTVSVINAPSEKVAAGVIFNVNPPNSGIITCNNCKIFHEYLLLCRQWNILHSSAQ